MLFEANIRDFLHLLPWNRIKRRKRSMRELLAQKRRIMTKEDIDRQSALIMEQLEQMSCFREAKVVMLYYPIHHEVTMLPLIKKYKHEKTFLFPVTHRHFIDACPYEGNDKMKRGKYHIPEPTTQPFTGNMDVILVPGVAFDKQCNRLGRGGGYYDTFLAHHHHHATLIGVGFDFQLVDEVPVDRHDVKLDRVIFPSRTLGI